MSDQLIDITFWRLYDSSIGHSIKDVRKIKQGGVMDIAIRAGESIGGTRRDMQLLLREGKANSQAHFYRGPRPRHCDPGDRVFFLENGFFHGYAIFREYDWRQADPGSGAQDGWAIVVEPPYEPIDPPIRTPSGFSRGRWPWRYIDSHLETLEILRRAGF